MNQENYVLDALEKTSAWVLPEEDQVDAVNDQACRWRVLILTKFENAIQTTHVKARPATCGMDLLLRGIIVYA
jgi:hypothetical protein